MKSRLLFIGLLAVLLVGCAPAARTVANQGDDVVRLIGDDVARIVTNYGDDVARTSQQYADDIGRQAQYSDEAMRYWDDVLRASQTYDDRALVLLYRDESLTPLQASFVTALRKEAKLSENESLLYLQSVCSVANFVQYFARYPDQSATEFYIKEVAAENGILIFAIADFTESVLEYAAWLIERSGPSPQEGASVLFEGLCLVSDVLEN